MKVPIFSWGGRQFYVVGFEGFCCSLGPSF